MLRVAGAMVVCAGLAGCGAEEAGRKVQDAVDPVAEAAARTAASGGARIDGRMWTKVRGIRVTMEVTGAVSFEEDRLALRLDYAEHGLPGVGAGELAEARRDAGFPHEQILDGDAVLVTNPAVRERAGHDKWARIDLAKLDDEAGLDTTGVAGMSEINPQAMLEFLRTAGHSREAGVDTVDGARTTRYHAAIDYADYPNTVGPEEREAAERTVELLRKSWGDTAVDVTVWIDEAGLIRREGFAFDVPVGGEKIPGKARIDFLDVGRPPAIDLPGDDDVIDVTDQAIEHYG